MQMRQIASLESLHICNGWISHLPKKSLVAVVRVKVGFTLPHTFPSKIYNIIKTFAAAVQAFDSPVCETLNFGWTHALLAATSSLTRMREHCVINKMLDNVQSRCCVRKAYFVRHSSVYQWSGSLKNFEETPYIRIQMNWPNSLE